MNLEQKVMQVSLDEIIPNRFQPRLNFDERGLEELANSIRQHGVIQPLVLRRVGDKYEIIAGERRFKASAIAGLTTVPAVIAQIDDNKSAEVAIVENVQRRDLTPIEEARSYKNLLDKGYLTQSELAKKMGISQSAIANKLRLLNLDESVQKALLNNEISERHARSLLVLQDKNEQKKWLAKIINERMTVRDLDEALKKLLTKPKTPEEESDIPLVTPLDIDAIRNEATELPSLNEQSEIARKLREIEIEKKFNPDVIPVEEATNNSKGNFFNFLENETVNMNTEERDLDIPDLNINSDTEENEEEPHVTEEINEEKEEEPKKSLEIKPAIELPKIEKKEVGEEVKDIKPAKEIELPSLNKQEEEKPSIKEEPKKTTDFIIPSLTKNDDDNFDPISLIDKLNPDYEEKVEESLGIDLKSAINEIRNCKDNLSSKGFHLSLEESDLDDTYQFIIKIKKN